MSEKDQSESEIEWELPTYTEEELEEKVQEQKERVKKHQEQKERGEFDDLPHIVSFELEHSQTLGVNCQTELFPNKAEAQEIKSKLEQVVSVSGARVKRI